MFVVRACLFGLLVCAPTMVFAQSTASPSSSPAAPGIDPFIGADVTLAGDGTIRRARKLHVALEGATPAARAESFVTRFGHRLGLNGARIESVRPRGERTLVRLQPTHNGVPILDGGVVLTLEGSHLTALNNEAPRLRRIESTQIDADAARRLAADALAAHGIPGAAPQIARLGIVTLGPVGTPVFEVDWAGLSLNQHWVLRIDAHRGRLIGVDQRGKH